MPKASLREKREGFTGKGQGVEIDGSDLYQQKTTP
jgi:hypothetical protein